jgi:hypothetical protein
MADIFWNITSGTLSADPGASGTTISSAALANLPVVTAPDTLRLTLDPDGVGGQPEVVPITNHAASATTATVIRGDESASGGSVGRAHSIGTKWTVSWTKAHADQLPYRLTNAKGDLIVGTGDKAVARLAVGANDLPLVADSTTGSGLAYKQLPTAGHADLSITSAKLAADSVIAGKIATGGVSASTQLAAGVVNNAALGALAVDGPKLAAGAVTAGKIATGGVSAAAQLAAGVVDTAALGALAVDSSKLAANSVIAGKIATGGVSAAGQFAAGVVDAAALGTGAVTNAKLDANAVTSDKITDLTIVGGDIANATIGAGKIASEAWTAYTPSVTNITVGNGVWTAKYIKLGRLVVAKIRLSFGSTSVMGTNPTISMPFPAVDDTMFECYGFCYDSSAGNRYPLHFAYGGADVIVPLWVRVDGLTGIQGGSMINTSPIAPGWATNDFFTVTMTYEATS